MYMTGTERNIAVTELFLETFPNASPFLPHWVAFHCLSAVSAEQFHYEVVSRTQDYGLYSGLRTLHSSAGNNCGQWET